MKKYEFIAELKNFLNGCVLLVLTIQIKKKAFK